MTTFTEIVATVVVHSSAVALSHFGVTMEPTQQDRAPPPVERVIARTPAASQMQMQKVMKLTACTQPHRPAHPLKA
jgi:hypothetical protein